MNFSPSKVFFFQLDMCLVDLLLYFPRFFALYPEYQKIFHRFFDIPRANLPDNVEFNSQTLTVMNFLEKLVDNLGGNADSMMAAQAELHKGWAVGYPQFKV